MKKIFHVYIPCYNEAENIPELLERCVDLHYYLNSRGIELLVFPINDCSQDNTRQVIQKFDQRYSFISLLDHSENKNLVGTLETSFEHALDWEQKNYAPGEFIGLGLLDGDNSHNPLTFLPMIDHVLEGYDVVIASRYQTNAHIEGVSAFRQVLSLGVSCLFRLFGRVPNVRDYSCGFRAYSTEIIHKLNKPKFEYRSFACMVELLKKCHRLDAHFREVPFCLRYDKKIGASKMVFLKTIFESLKVLFLH